MRDDLRNKVSAFVLAGGASTRMGMDKAFLAFRGASLLEHALDQARAVSSRVAIVGARDKFAAFAEVVEDKFGGHGPLGGIHAALLASTTEMNLILAVDTPFLETTFLQHLLQRAAESAAIVTVPRCGGLQQAEAARLHPLCAVYRRSFVDLAAPALRAHRNRIDALFDPATTLIIEQEEIERLGFNPAMFRNLNSPEDMQRAEADVPCR